MGKGRERDPSYEPWQVVKPRRFGKNVWKDPATGKTFTARDAEALFGRDPLADYPPGNGSGMIYGWTAIKRLPADFHGSS